MRKMTAHLTIQRLFSEIRYSHLYGKKKLKFSVINLYSYLKQVIIRITVTVHYNIRSPYCIREYY